LLVNLFVNFVRVFMWLFCLWFSAGEQPFMLVVGGKCQRGTPSFFWGYSKKAHCNRKPTATCTRQNKPNPAETNLSTPYPDAEKTQIKPRNKKTNQNTTPQKREGLQFSPSNSSTNPTTLSRMVQNKAPLNTTTYLWLDKNH